MYEYSTRIICSIALLFIILFPAYGCAFSLLGLASSVTLYFVNKKISKRDIIFALTCFLLSALVIVLELIIISRTAQ